MLTESLEDSRNIFSSSICNSLQIIFLDVCRTESEHPIDNRLIDGCVMDSHDILTHSQKALVRTVFLREHISGNRLFVVDKHDVHGAVANVTEHIDALELGKSVSNCGKALRKHICSDDLHMVLSAAETELDLAVLRKVVFEIASLTAYPCEGKTGCNVNLAGGDLSDIQLPCNRRKSKNVVVNILCLIRKELFMTFTDQIISAVIDKQIVFENRFSIIDCHACREAAVCGFDIAVSAVDPDDEYIFDFFHALTSVIRTMIKSIKTILAQDKEKFKVPSKVQDLIPIKCIWPDGIFKIGNKFSKTYKFSDINYLVASREDKESMFLTYSELLNSLDSGATTKITINNHRLNKADFEGSILMPLKHDGLDGYRIEYNDMLLDKATGANGITQEKYMTISVAKKDIEEARAYFARVGADLTSHFANLGSKCVALNAVERLRILHDFYRPGDETAFEMNVSKKARLGHDFRDYICPDSIERTADHIKLGEKYARVLFLKDYASYIKDSMVSELTELNRNLMLSIDVIPIPTDEAVREVENRLLGVETNITNWQRKQNQNNNFSAVVPYDMELQRKESKEFLDDLTTRDQRMMFAVITMVITADTKEQLDLDTEMVLSTARKHMCQMATLKYQQTDGLNTVLPYGLRKINTFRTLTTESLAVFMPFKVQEIMDKGGIFFGENAISHNLIMCNKANLLNQSAFLLGVPGSGKSFSAKELITFLMLNTDDDILICDPEGEYAPLVEAMGDLGSVIRVSAGGRDRLNAMYMVDGYGENNPIVVKSEFIMSLIEQIDKKGVGPQHKSIIDRCITNVYRNAAEAGTIPTLCTLRDMLLEQPEPEAKQIALSLELYTTGSLDIFGKQSNVDLDRRIVVFDIHGLGSQLKPTGLLVITDTMLNRVTLNWKKGKRTHVFIDEFHVVFENEFSAQFFNSAWRQFRKRNAYPTAITQNVEYLLDSVQASTLSMEISLLLFLLASTPITTADS